MASNPSFSPNLPARTMFYPICVCTLQLSDIVPLEHVEAVHSTSHFEGAEGQTSQEDVVFEVVFMRETDLAPVTEVRKGRNDN
jgi:hypothetical protein